MADSFKSFEYDKLIRKYEEDNKDKISRNKIKKMFIENLPISLNEKIDWKYCINYDVYFIHKNIKGFMKIVNYNLNNRKLTILYNNKEYEINTSDFKYCKIGRIIGTYTKEFRIGIDEIIKDDKRDLIIIDREIRVVCEKNNKKHNYRYYKYHCNKCGYEGWIIESSLLNHKHGCSLCSNQVVVEGINDIPTTNPEMIKYFQGGYDEAKLYTKSSNKYIYAICPICGHIKDKKVKVNSLYRAGLSCFCNDGISYVEKFTNSILKQLNLDFQTQLTKSTFKWIGKYKYDFYFEYNNEQYILETHGLQHYEESFKNVKSNKNRRSLEEEQENDKLKKELALLNGVKEQNYIVVDCRYSDLEWIKQNILESRLAELFDLSKIDWLKSHEFALKTKVKDVCDLWESGIHNVIEIGNIIGLSNTTVTKYLHKGKVLNWCNSYDPKEILSERSRKLGLSCGKPIEVFKDNVSLGVFPSAKELERQSEKLFGVKFDSRGISRVCNNKRKSHREYEFKFA